jgi:PAS domain S-box-containing protein
MIYIYMKYLGSKVAVQLPQAGIEFPLIIEEEGYSFARTIVKVHDDGSLSFSGDVEEGSSVRFGIGDIEAIVEHADDTFYRLQSKPVESLFVYSCAGRKSFLKDDISKELEKLSTLAPMSGFFTYGEFYTHQYGSSLLKQSMTVLSLSESEVVRQTIEIATVAARRNNLVIEALSHLTNVTAKEAEDLNQKLIGHVDQKNRELESSQLFFQTIFETANEGIWVLDKNFITTQVNMGVCKILGFAQEDIVGKPFKDFIDESLQEKFFKQTQHGYLINEQCNEIIFRDSNDKKLYCLISIESIKNMNDKEDAYFAMISDITQRQESQKELVELNSLLEERISDEVLKNREKDALMFQQLRHAQMGEMISMIAHQWRQPLTAISTLTSGMKLDLVLGTPDFDVYEKSLDYVDEHVQHLSETINDFRNFFNPNKELEASDIQELVDNALSIVGASLKQHSIELKIDITTTKNVLVFSNEVTQMILNLLKNAQDVFEEKEILNPYITIKAYEEDSLTVVEISDNAGGIPETIIDKIFDPYFSTKDAKNGTGLGLYMSKTIVEEHCKGRLNVHNTSDGCCFVIKLNQV